MTVNNVSNVTMGDAVGKNFIDYAMSVIVERALPDVRDGLKPVQRRILYGAGELGLTADKPYKKCARIVGDVLGKYHPHGDLSVYEAMVRMAQDFSLRYPLVDGHGNFGSVDGDGAAAMRYTEARLSRFGQAMLEDINKNTIDFIPNFDGEEKEASVLPTLIPNLLVNGTSGIAVGMATNMPSHNINDVYNSLNYIIDCTITGEEVDEEVLIDKIQAPDFATGANILNSPSIREAYKTGEGRVTMRATMEVDEEGKIVITELPYKVNKAKLVERIDLLSRATKEKNKKDKPAIIPEIKEVRDESDRNGMRVVVELKKGTNPQLVYNKLLKNTDLQKNFSINNVVISDGEPRTVSLKDSLNLFLKHSADVIIRRTMFDIEKASRRHNIVLGILSCFEDDMLNRVIDAIRHSDNVITALMELGFNKEQAEHISEMKIKALSNASEVKLNSEKEIIETNLSYWNEIVNNNIVLLETMKKEYEEIRSKFSDERKTKIINDSATINEEDLVKDETLVITITDAGLIKSVSEKEYNTQNRGGKGTKAATTKEDEIIKYMFTTNSKDNIMFFTNKGRVHLLKAFKIPKSNKSARGRSLFNFLSLDLENGETIVNVISADTNDKEKGILLATRNGVLKRLQLDNLSSRMSVTKVIEFKEGDSLTAALLVSEGDEVILNSSYGMSIKTLITKETVRPSGRTARGVNGMKLKKEDDYLLDVSLCNKDYVFTLTESGLGKKTLVSEYTLQRRGGIGTTSHKITDKTGKVVAANTVNDDDDIFIVTEQGQMIRIKASSVSATGRNASGVRLVRLNEGDAIAGMSVSNFNEDEEEVSE